jgi:hypothetical protein
LAKEFFRQKLVLKVIEDYGNDLIALMSMFKVEE